MSRPDSPRWVFVLLLGLLAPLAGCSPGVEFKAHTEVPKPLMARIPVTLGVHYEKTFRSYTYTGDSQDRPNWRIEIGDAQIALFDRILSSMFRNIAHVKAIPDQDNAGRVAGIISPEVAEFQCTLPSETDTDFYEAQIKYEVRLYEPDGRLVARWPVAGYGKSPSGLLTTANEGLGNALDLALRDAGAQLALGFEKVAEVRKWLCSVGGECAHVARAH
jgi:hypothetical protein